MTIAIRRLFVRDSFAVVALPLLAALCALGMLKAAAPAYLGQQGFPLDDAWIHAVYARELARTGMLAYNPGMPATGETSPLWAVVLAWPHWIGGTSTIVAATKATGFALHLASAVLMATVAWHSSRSKWVAAGAGSLVAMHPDLVAASVSGMEVPLATLAIAGTAYATVRGRAALVAASGAAAFLARPETALIAVLCALVYTARRGARTCLRLSAAALIGSVSALACVAVRNVMVSGRPLPATFYAKAALHPAISLEWQRVGFTQVFASMPVVGVPSILALLALASVLMLVREEASDAARLGATLALCGLAFCALSFSLIPPLDPAAFYHQRYVLPALLPILASIPLLTREAARIRPSLAVLLHASVATLFVASSFAAAPARFRRLSNDARNIDDVQVELGRSLKDARPSEAAWMIDAGAARYFGAPFVVDLLALNTFELMTPDAQAFLDRHPPRYVDEFRQWSTVRMSDGGSVRRQTFAPSTPYTVTSFPYMSQHTLIACDRQGRQGLVAVRTRTFWFTCAQTDVARMKQDDGKPQVTAR